MILVEQAPAGRTLGGFGFLGETCAPGYFFEEGAGCLMQTQQLANNLVGPGGTIIGAPTQWTPDIYGPAGGTTRTLGPPTEKLTSAVRDWLRSRGVRVDCKEVCDVICVQSGMTGACCQENCSVNGGPYEHQAGVLNRNPAILLVEMGQSPVGGTNAPALRPPASSSTPARVSSPSTAPPAGHHTSLPGPGQTPSGGAVPPAPAAGGPLGPEAPATGNFVAQVQNLATQQVAGLPVWGIAIALAGFGLLALRGGR